MSFDSRWTPKPSPLNEQQRATAPQDGVDPRQPDEWRGPSWSPDERKSANWVIHDLCSRPDLIQRWKHMRDNPPGRGLHARSQHEIAAKIIRACEDHLGQAL